MKAVIKLSIILLVASMLQAQTPAPKKKANKPVNPDVQALKEAVAAQQEQIKALSQQLQQTSAELQQTNQQFQQTQQQLQQTAADAASKATAAQAEASQQQQAVVALQGDLADLKSVNGAASNNAVLKNAVLSLEESLQTCLLYTSPSPRD